ncbi:MAG: hypothetical protein L0H63_12170, partial [Nitrococcus sp.]|nr:hypothetical protein [Nitrococcus sp.]
MGQPTRAGSYATNVRYQPNGAIASFRYGNGVVHELLSNSRGLPERSRDTYAGSAVHDYSLDYDRNGNVAAISDARPGQPDNRRMFYDGLDRLVGVIAPMLGGDGEAVYVYDTLDNLIGAQVGSKPLLTYHFQHNRLTNVRNAAGATVVGLGYDARGNVTNKSGATLDFDYGNRLRSTTLGGAASHYVYDGLGRRVGDTTVGGAKISQYSQAGQLLHSSDQRRQRISNYVYLGGSLVAVTQQPTAGGATTVRYQHTDALGSPVAVTDASGAVVERYQYEPYGALLGQPNPDGPGYTGHVMDAATGLTYMQQRYFDPSLGRFLSVDPVPASPSTGANFNRYWYANNNPYSFTDPDGRAPNKAGVTGPLHVYNALQLGGLANLRDTHGGNSNR